MNIVVLAANQPEGRFYRGGRKIDKLRGVDAGGDFRPEDWVASTTTLAGEPHTGLSRLPNGDLLADAVAADPLGWLGPHHVASFGPSTMLLVKLLDAGQRLPVHAHPDDEFSRAHVHRPFGKAEAWYILEGGSVRLGLREDVTKSRLEDLVARQDIPALTTLLHERPVSPGDVVYVPPGELHAIGEGVLLVELQQPEDLSILLEWDGFALDGARDGHLGLGFDIALEAVTRTGRSATDIDDWIHPGTDGESILPPESEAYFGLERRRIADPVRIERGFAVVVVESGTIEVSAEHGGSTALGRGSTVVIPYAAGALTVTGEGVVLVCRPPRPHARRVETALSGDPSVS